MTTSNSSSGLTLRYTEKFQCLGGKCPELCCLHWDVPLEKSAYDRLEVLIPEAEFKHAIVLQDAPNDAHHARIEMDAQGVCPFLDPQDKLCSIHKQHGEQALGSHCKQYPRRYAIMGRREEMTMALSCPEVARLCLLGESATDFIALPEEKMLDAGDPAWHSQSDAPEVAYQGYMDILREIFMQLAGLPGLDARLRGYLGVYFAGRISEFVSDQSDSVDEARLSEVLAHLEDKDAIVTLNEEFDAMEQDIEFPLNTIQSVLSSTFSAAPSYQSMITDMLAKEGIVCENGRFNVAQGNVNDAFDRLVGEYQARSIILQQRYGERLDQYFKNYARNFWFRELFTQSPTPLYHTMDLVVRMTLIRFLFAFHPSVEVLVEELEAPANGIELLDNAAVDTFYKFSRGIEHSQQQLSAIYQTLDEQGQVTPDNLASLLRF